MQVKVKGRGEVKAKMRVRVGSRSMGRDGRPSTCWRGLARAVLAVAPAAVGADDGARRVASPSCTSCAGR